MNAPVPHQTLSTQPFSKWFEVHPGLGISMMDHLFNRLDGAYPHKWRSAFPNQQAIDNFCESWAEAFEEEGITPNDVKVGLKACRNTFDWPPSCAEFIKACKTVEKKEPAYVFALPAPKSELSREKAAQMLVELGAAEVMKPKVDHKLWAKRIIKRSKQPMHGLSALQIRWAKEAVKA
jgi:hypothetical protein